MGRKGWFMLACAGLLACGRTSSDAPSASGGAAAVALGGAAGAALDGSAAAALGGAAGAAAVQPAPATAEPIPAISGLWMLFGWEDPVTVDLQGAGGAGTAALSGRGCADGPYHLDGEPADQRTAFTEAQACSRMSGSAVGNHFKFELVDLDQPPSLGSLHTAAYGFDVYASSAGDRMSGAINVTLDAVPDQPIIDYLWLPFDRLAFSEPSPSRPARQLAPLQAGTPLTLKLRDAQPLGDLVPEQIYRAYLRTSYGRFKLVGNLGAYFDAELSYDAASHRFTAGPVAPTRPHHPVALSVQFADDDVTVLEATVTTADGDSGTLVSAPEP